MPGFDGTGPRGQGPMTGGGRGFCVLKVPPTPAEPISGVAGSTGWSVFGATEAKAELTRLRLQAQNIEMGLRALHSQIERLEASRR